MTSGAVSAFLVRQRIHELMRQFTDLGENCTFFPREGGPRITPQNLDTVSTGRVSGIHASDYGGSWKNSFIFHVNVDSEWKGTLRTCFRIQRCAWSDGNEISVEQFIAPWSLKRRLTESFTPEFLARRWVEHSFGAAVGSRTVEQFRAPCFEYCARLNEWSGPGHFGLVPSRRDGRANSPQGWGETIQWLPRG